MKLAYDKDGSIVALKDGVIVDRIETMGNNLYDKPAEKNAKGLFLTACESNWGLNGPGDMVKQSWKVYRDGRFSYRASYLPVDDKVVPDQCVEDVVGPEDLRRLAEAADEPWPSDLVEACDGSAWEFSAFGAGGKVVKHRRQGYIYGLEVFERIASALWGLLEDPSTDHPGEEDCDGRFDEEF